VRHGFGTMEISHRRFPPGGFSSRRLLENRALEGEREKERSERRGKATQELDKGDEWGKGKDTRLTFYCVKLSFLTQRKEATRRAGVGEGEEKHDIGRRREGQRPLKKEENN